MKRLHFMWGQTFYRLRLDGNRRAVSIALRVEALNNDIYWHGKSWL